MIGDFDGGVPPEPDGFDVENEYETIKEVAGKITIDDTSVPIINEGAKTELRKGNAVDLKRQTTVHFPAQGLGSEWINLFGIFNTEDRPSNPVVTKPVDIEFRNHSTEEWVLVHRGYVSGLGSGKTPNDVQLQIGSITDFLSTIPAGETFTTNSTLTDVIEYIVGELEDGQPVFDSVTVVGEGALSDSTQVVRGMGYYTEEANETFAEGGGIDTEAISKWFSELGEFDLNPFGETKKFTKNRHTLADVFEWFKKRINARIWFEPAENGGVILAIAEQYPTRTYRDTALGGETEVLGNNALYNIQPQNQLKLKGAATTVITDAESGSAGVYVNTEATQKYPQVTVQYDPLVKRSGGELQQQGESSGSTIKGVENEARHRLKDLLDNAGGGMIRTSLEPTMTPYCVLETHPAVNAALDMDVNPLSYEVESIEHVAQARPSRSEDEVGMPHSNMRVSMWVDPRRITVVDAETGMMNAT